jgi:hypothetical protein
LELSLQEYPFAAPEEGEPAPVSGEAAAEVSACASVSAQNTGRM